MLIMNTAASSNPRSADRVRRNPRARTGTSDLRANRHRTPWSGIGRRPARTAVAESGQTTAEYALVLLAAGTIAMLVVAWAQGNDAVGSLFDAVLSRITSLMA